MADSADPATTVRLSAEEWRQATAVLAEARVCRLEVELANAKAELADRKARTFLAELGKRHGVAGRVELDLEGGVMRVGGRDA